MNEELKSCKLNACIHFSEKAKLNCSHPEIESQDTRPSNLADCPQFKPQLEVVLRKGKYFIRSVLNCREIEFGKSRHEDLDEAGARIINAADQLQVRPKDVFIIQMSIPNSDEEQLFCESCSKFQTERCSFKVDQAKPNKDSVACQGFEKRVFKSEKWEEEEESSKKPSQADKLVQLCLEHSPLLFHDEHKTPYARIQEGGVNVTLPVRSKPFKTWLANLLWQHEEKAPGTEAIYSAMNVLEAMAVFKGSQHTLYNRVAPAEDGFWIDMADEKWRAIKVTAEDWKIVDDPPILFKRYSHQLPLVEPKRGGDPWKFLDFVNVDKEDEAAKLTLLCTVISFLIPSIPHVITVLYGIQGSGKTCLFKLIRRLIDPSAVEVLTLPRDERERIQQLDHNWCAFYDNVTSLPSWMSDTLCRAATGGGFTKRELYTDDQDVIYDFKRCVGLNGINIAAQRGDLLDRSLLIGLKDISKEKRRTEKELLNAFKNCEAEILGGFLDTLVKATQIYPSLNPRLFRMADFTRWGCAIAIALGKTEKDFIDAYETKVKAQIEEAAHASPVATVLLDFMEKRREDWNGTPTELFSALLNHAKKLEISTRQKVWPKAPHVLVRQLNELAPSLKSLGWEVNNTRTGLTRRIEISTVTSVTSVIDHENDGKTSDATLIHEASQASSQASLKNNVKSPLRDASDASDAISPSSLGVSVKLSIPEMFEVLHNELPKGREFTEQQFLDCVVKHGWTRQDHDVFFKKLVDEGSLLRTSEGDYTWA